jgi:hypothetical protein
MSPKGICIDVTKSRPGFRGKELIGDTREITTFVPLQGYSFMARKDRGISKKVSEDYRKFPEPPGTDVAETSGARISP